MCAPGAAIRRKEGRELTLQFGLGGLVRSLLAGGRLNRPGRPGEQRGVAGHGQAAARSVDGHAELDKPAAAYPCQQRDDRGVRAGHPDRRDLLVEHALRAGAVPAKLAVSARSDEARQVPAARGRGRRAEVEVHVAELERVRLRCGDRELRSGGGRRAGGSGGWRGRASSLDDREYAPVSDQEEHRPGNGTRNPDKPPAAGSAPRRGGVAGASGLRPERGQCLIIVGSELIAAFE
jgi:hypothetical protein